MFIDVLLASDRELISRMIVGEVPRALSREYDRTDASP
jgi:hypothetical protein